MRSKRGPARGEARSWRRPLALLPTTTAKFRAAAIKKWHRIKPGGWAARPSGAAFSMAFPTAHGNRQADGAPGHGMQFA